MDKSPAKISVVVPSFNRREYLRQTIDSILAQTVDSGWIECIVCDGGSTDGTVAMLQEYGDAIRWVSESDHGQGDAINKGWGMASGQVLTWLNADDRWKPDAVAIALQYFDKHPEMDVVHGLADLIDLDGAITGSAHVTPWDMSTWLAECDYCITQPASFIRRRILDEVGFLDLSYILIDLELWSRIALAGRIGFVPEVLAETRSHSAYDRSRFGLDQVRITRKTVCDPRLPKEFVSLRKRALSRAYLQAVEYERESPHKSRLRLLGYFYKALAADPSDWRQVYKRVIPAVSRILGKKTVAE